MANKTNSLNSLQSWLIVLVPFGYILFGFSLPQKPVDFGISTPNKNPSKTQSVVAQVPVAPSPSAPPTQSSEASTPQPHPRYKSDLPSDMSKSSSIPADSSSSSSDTSSSDTSSHAASDETPSSDNAERSADINLKRSILAQLDRIYITMFAALENKDTDTYFAFISPDFLLVSEDGKEENFDRYKEMMEDLYKNYKSTELSHTIDSMNMPDEDTAVVEISLDGSWTASNGEVSKGIIHFRDTWVRKDGSWRLLRLEVLSRNPQN